MLQVCLDEVVQRGVRTLSITTFQPAQALCELKRESVSGHVNTQGVCDRFHRAKFVGGEVGHVEIMDHAGNRHRANVGVLFDDVVRRRVRKRQHSDVRGGHPTQGELVDTSKDHRALTSASTCLSDRQRLSRAHSGLLLR